MPTPNQRFDQVASDEAPRPPVTSIRNRYLPSQGSQPTALVESPSERVCKPDSVAPGTRERQGPAIIPLAPWLPTESSDLPGDSAGPASNAPLFGLAPCGVYPARPVTRTAVRSYRTFSPLPPPVAQEFGGVFFCGTFPEVTLAGR